MSLFLSYAHEDSRRAKEIAEKLRQRNHDVYRFEDPEELSARFPGRIEEEINAADGFIALISPAYLTSPWCRRERELAFIRENDLQSKEPTKKFIHVVQVSPTPRTGSGLLRPYNWLKLDESDDLGPLLDALSPGPPPEGAAEGRRRGSQAAGMTLGAFRNREYELEQLVQGIKTPGGNPFWLVVAPPQLGKSWLLDRLVTDLADGTGGAWRVRLVDIRVQPMSVRIDVAELLRQMFPTEGHGPTEPGDIREIGRMIGSTDQPYACLLDGAELLDRTTTTELRERIFQILQWLTKSGHPSGRLAIVVSGRQEGQWLGVIPRPRLARMTLTEFRPDVVGRALLDLANHMNRHFSPEVLNEQAAQVHRFTEGLPALLVECLKWIQRDNWAAIAELHTDQLFTQIAEPYVKSRLLGIESLVPEGGRDLRLMQDVLCCALRVLSPYRVLTLSHLAHHWDDHDDFREAIARVGWEQTELWDAVTRTALLSRFLDEVWSAFHRPIRRLLFRHFHRTDEEQIIAHREAGSYVEQWMDGLLGKECGTGIVERLWHEASATALESPQDLDENLCKTARRIRQFLRSSSGYTVNELQQFIAGQIADDGELQGLLDAVPDLSDRLTAIILSSPSGGSGE